MGRSKIPQLHCLRPVCKNPELLLRGIKKNCDNIDILTKCHNLLEKIVCDPVTQPCVDKKCTSCPPLDMEAINDCERIDYYTWKKDKYYKKVLCEISGEKVYSMTELQIDNTCEHYYQKQ